MPGTEHDIEDEFKRAAEKYKLKEVDSDWDKISGSISPTPPLHAPASGKKRKIVFLSLLLLLFTTAGIYFLRSYTAGDPASELSVKQRSAEDFAAPSQDSAQPKMGTAGNENSTPVATEHSLGGSNSISYEAPVNSNNSEKFDKRTQTKSSKPSSLEIEQQMAGSSQSSPADNESTTLKDPRVAPGGNSNTGSFSQPSAQQGTSSVSVEFRRPRPNTDKRRIGAQAKQEQPDQRRKRKHQRAAKSAIEVIPATAASDTPNEKLTVSTDNKEQEKLRSEQMSTKDPRSITKDANARIEVIAAEESMDSMIKDPETKIAGLDTSRKSTPDTAVIARMESAPDSNKTKEHVDSVPIARSTVQKPLQRKGKFLLGIAGGPEWNQIHGQRITRAGFDAGIIAGFTFNKRFSIESGIAFARKYYYSSGKHFKLDMPGKEIVSLTGRTNIIEIPLSVKYNFLVRPGSNLYASLGAMSYLLTDEQNDYILLVNGARMNMTNEYPEGSRYLAAAVNLAVGYEAFLNNRTSLRISPYLQFPLKGIGVGSLEVMSTGLHFGVTRTFGK